MRRLFAFLFRHDFDISKGRLNFVQSTVRRSMVCRKCGFETELCFRSWTARNFRSGTGYVAALVTRRRNDGKRSGIG